MPTRKRQGLGVRTFATPVVLILGLLMAHFVLSDWSALPRLISSTLASIN